MEGGKTRVVDGNSTVGGRGKEGITGASRKKKKRREISTARSQRSFQKEAMHIISLQWTRARTSCNLGGGRKLHVCSKTEGGEELPFSEIVRPGEKATLEGREKEGVLLQKEGKKGGWW